MYRLATIHSVTDRQTDRRTGRQRDDIMMTIADPAAWHTYCGFGLGTKTAFCCQRYVCCWWLIYIQGEHFLTCCEKNDYEVTVGEVQCPIRAVIHNAISCSPSQDKPPSSHFDKDGASRVVVMS